MIVILLLYFQDEAVVLLKATQSTLKSQITLDSKAWSEMFEKLKLSEKASRGIIIFS